MWRVLQTRRPKLTPWDGLNIEIPNEKQVTAGSQSHPGPQQCTGLPSHSESMAGRVRTCSLLPPLSGLHLPQPQWPLAIPPAFHTPFSVSLNLAFPPPRLLLLQIPKHTLYPSGAFSVVTFSRSFFLTVLFGSVTLITQELPIGGLFLLVISGDTTGFNYWLLGFSLPLHTPHLET